MCEAKRIAPDCPRAAPESSAAQPLDKPAARGHARAMTKPPADHAADHAAEHAADRPAEHAAGRPADRSAGERIAKALARAGVASRREAERMIEAGRVSVNGRVIDGPALNVAPSDRLRVDGRDVKAPEPPRLWLYHKPPGLVTTASDERGRPTVFAALPADMPRVMSVGRLDLTSEGLLLLTNDGAIKRRLELPSTGWLRRYRVRVHGAPQDAALEPLRRGLTIGGERFQPMSVALDRQQGANAWLTISLREGRNREIRRAMEAVGLRVNRLIRVSYGPFQLGGLVPGAVEEVRPRVLRDQLGLAEEPPGARPDGPKPPRAERRSLKPKGSAPERAAGAAPRAPAEAPRRPPSRLGGRGADRKASAAGGPKPEGRRRDAPPPAPPRPERRGGSIEGGASKGGPPPRPSAPGPARPGRPKPPGGRRPSRTPKG